MEDLVPQPPSGRTFRVGYRVRLSDADATGRLRLDAVARYLQDAAIDDVAETNWGAPEHLWVLRAVRIDVLRPFLEDGEVDIVTWGSSFSSLAAGRRWSLTGDAGGAIEVDSTWIHLGRRRAAGAHRRGLRGVRRGRAGTRRVDEAHAPRARDRRETASRGRCARRTSTAWGTSTTRRTGRRSSTASPGATPDLRLPHRARLEYRHPIDLGEQVELAEATHDGRYGAAFVVDGHAKAVAWVEQLRS